MKGYKKCEERIDEELRERIEDLRELYDSDEWKGNLENYGLGFDYVPPQEEEPGYFRYLLSWGGPSDEFRFFVDHKFKVVEVEYWFLDWYDGAKRVLTGDDFELLKGIWDSWLAELAPQKMNEALEE